VSVFSVAGAFVLGVSSKVVTFPRGGFSQSLWAAEVAVSSVASHQPWLNVGEPKLWIWGCG
jgi:hypothetical protein